MWLPKSPALVATLSGLIISKYLCPFCAPCTLKGTFAATCQCRPCLSHAAKAGIAPYTVATTASFEKAACQHAGVGSCNSATIQRTPYTLFLALIEIAGNRFTSCMREQAWSHLMQTQSLLQCLVTIWKLSDDLWVPDT